MPRFLYSTALLALGLLAGLFFIVWKMSPSATVSRLLFLGDLTATVTLYLAIVFYFFSRNRKKLFVEPRNVFRKQLRRGFLIAILISTVVSLKFWGGFNKLNIVLVILFVTTLEIFLNRKKKAQMLE